MTAVGDRIEVAIRGVAHGGAMLAEIVSDEQRRTVFVRHALPGERGSAVVTATRSSGRLLFADLVEVAQPSPDRVVPPCRYSGPDGCGGCDFQHVALPAQRKLKADVVADCIRRIARLDLAEVPWDGTVHAVPGDQDGLRWRTRARFVAAGRRLAMRRHRSRQTVAIDDCLIACEGLTGPAASAAHALGGGRAAEIAAVQTSSGERMAAPTDELAGIVLHEMLQGRRFAVAADGFWQVHPGAADALTRSVARALEPRPGEALLDLFAGVGIFAASLADLVGDGPVHLVEADATAARLARRNFAGRPGVACHAREVLAWLRSYRGPADVVVLDPPRSGAGTAVLRELDRLRPRALAYVACDPAALSRDLRTLTGLGWRLTSLAAFDIFPMTHHIECVAGLESGAAPS